MVKPLSEGCVNTVVAEGIPITSVTPDYVSQITRLAKCVWAGNEASKMHMDWE